jgi:hypothetical protein
VRLLDGTPEFTHFAHAFDVDQVTAWHEARKFFDENEELIQKIRNDVGGHFGEVASRYAVTNVDRDYASSLTLEYDFKRDMRVSVGFAGELAATALLRHAPGDLAEERARFVFALLAEALRHAMGVVYATFGPSVWHKLGK